jgi:hypothetical protein
LARHWPGGALCSYLARHWPGGARLRRPLAKGVTFASYAVLMALRAGGGAAG